MIGHERIIEPIDVEKPDRGQQAAGVEVIDVETKQTETFFAKIIFLNASTVGTAFILLFNLISLIINRAPI